MWQVYLFRSICPWCKMYVYQCSWSHCWLQWVHMHANTNSQTLTCLATYIHMNILRTSCLSVYKHAYKHTHMHKTRHSCMLSTYLYGNKHAYTCLWLSTHMHSFILHTHTCMDVCLYEIYVHAYSICMYALIHTCIYIYIYIYLCMSACIKTYLHAYKLYVCLHICIHTDS